MRDLFGEDEGESDPYGSQQQEPQAQTQVQRDRDNALKPKGAALELRVKANVVKLIAPSISASNSQQQDVYLCKLPSLIQFEPSVFDADTFTMPPPDAEDKHLFPVENVVRWRLDANGKRQSNAKIVTWDDGSQHLYLGSEVYVMNSTAVNGTNFIHCQLPTDYKVEEQASRCVGTVAAQFNLVNTGGVTSKMAQTHLDTLKARHVVKQKIVDISWDETKYKVGLLFLVNSNGKSDVSRTLPTHLT